MYRSEAASPQGGFSLLELVIAIVVLGLIFAGFVTVYATALRQSTEPALQAQALSVASSYLDEALAQAYRDPDTNLICGAAEAARPMFDNVCDYDQLVLNGCTATSGACPLPGDCACDSSGAPVDGLRGFTISLDVDPLSVSGSTGLLLEVAVRHAALGADGVTLQAFRTED